MATNGGMHDESELHRRLAALEARWGDMEKGNMGAMGTPVDPTNLKGDQSLGMAAALNRIALSTQLQGNQYRIANPGPLGLFSFGFSTFILQGYNTRWTEAGTDTWAYAYGLFFGGLAQFCAGMWEIYRNNVFGGTAFTAYGAFWMGFGILGTLASGKVYEGPGLYPKGSQMVLCLWGILTFLFFLATLVINISLMVLFFSLTITFFLLAAGETGHPKCTKAGGYFGVWTAAVAWYIATAELLNSVYGRRILPLGVVNMLTKEPSLTGVDRPNTI